jgi:pseudaminic acid cytidylyltransferase
MSIAIIPARGGSKRIPQKNIRDFLGKPIISYSIEIAKESKLFERIIVSTDDNEIAETATKYGAEVPFVRPSNLSDDYTGTHDVVGHAVKWLIDSGIKVENVCSIYPTAPLIQKKDLAKGFDLIKSGEWESVFAATKFSYPIFRSFHFTENGGLKMFFPDHYHSRSQDLVEAMHDAGQFYWANAKVWMQPPKQYNKNSTVILLPEWRVQDIDNLEDWKRAELIYQTLL